MKYSVILYDHYGLCVGSPLVSRVKGKFDEAYSYFFQGRKEKVLHFGQYSTKQEAWEEVFADAKEASSFSTQLFLSKVDE